MLRTVLTKTLRDGRRGLLFWGIGMAALVGVTVAFYPSLRDSPELNDFLESLPEAIVALIGESDLISPAGYLNSQLYGSLLPLILLFYSIGAGAGAVAGEEEAGTLDLLLANPVSRTRVLLEKWLAMLAGLLVIGVVAWLATWLLALVVEMEISGVRIAEVTLSAVLFAFLIGTLALALGAASGLRGLAVGVAAAVGIAAFLLNSLAPLVDVLEPLQDVSPFYYYYGADPLRNGLDPVHVTVLVVSSLVLAGLAVLGFRRRDLRV